MRTLLRPSPFLLCIALACAQHAPGSYEQGGRNYPVYTIGPACSNGVPNGQECEDNFDCCSGICLPNLTMPGMGICVECEVDSQCPDPEMYPICDTTSYTCVAAGVGPSCATLGMACDVLPCCSGSCIKSICSTPVKDSGSD